jgi:PAS domain S-box-containing protein
MQTDGKYSNAENSGSLPEFLSESKENYSTLTEVYPVGIFQADIDGNCLYLNNYWTQITGLDPKESMDQGWLEVIWEDDREMVFKQWKQCVESRLPFKSEFRIKDLQGKIHWVLVQSDLGKIQNGKAPGYIGTFTETTVSRETERILILQRDLNRKLSLSKDYNDASQILLDFCLQIEGIDSGGVYLIGQSGVQLIANAGLTDKFISKAAFFESGTFLAELINSPKPFYFQCSKLKEKFSQLKGTKEMDEFQQVAVIPVTRDEHNFAAITLASKTMSEIPALGKAALETIALNVEGIFQRILTEGELRQSESKNRTLLENIPQMVSLKDSLFNYVSCNKNFIKTFKLGFKEIAGKTDFDLFPELSEKFLAQDKKVIETGRSGHFEETITLEDSERIFKVLKSPVKDSNGTITGVICTYEDITEKKHIENALIQEKKKLQEVMETIPAFVFLRDRNFKIKFANSEFKRIFGNPEDGPCYKLIRHRDEPCDNCTAFKGFAPGEIRSWELVLPGGSSYMINDSAINDNDGSQLILSVGFDITERKDLEEAIWDSEERFRTIADFTYACEYWISPKGSFIYVSPSCERITGYTQDEFTNDDNLLQKIVHREDWAKISRDFTEYQSHINVNENEFRITTRNGDIRWIGHVSQPVYGRDGIFMGRRGSCRDCTEQKEAVQDMITAKEEAEKANKVKSQFIANMSHEIRTPMNAIMGFTNLVLNSKLDEEQKKCLEVVMARSKDLLVLINDILDISKIEADKLEIKNDETNLRQIIKEQVESFMPHIKEKDLSLNYEISPEVPEIIFVDPIRLRQVLVNIIGNAVKFTEQGSIKLSVKFADKKLFSGSWNRKEQMLHFSVEDTGIGIPEDKQKLIFEAFSQGDSSKIRKYGGTGLGLAICLRLLDMMGGTIWLKSQEGKGSTFNFLLPLSNPKNKIRVKKKYKKTTSETSKNQKILRILVADDDEHNRLLIQRILHPYGHTVIPAASGIEALKCMEDNNCNFDLVLMDIQMPEMNGYETVKRIRRDEKATGRHIPVIALTASTIESDHKRCIDVGMDDYLLKPINENTLKQALIDYC